MQQPKASSILTYFLYSFWLLLPLSVFAMDIFLWISDYEELTQLLLEAAGKIDWKIYFQKSVLPENRFILLRYGLLILLPLVVFLSIFLWKKTALIQSWLEQDSTIFIKKIKIQSRPFKHFTLQEKRLAYLLTGLFLMRSIFNIYHFELQYDEAWSYLHFSSKGFIISAISPNNNHISYTLLTCIFDWLPIAGKYVLRLPVLFGGIAAVLVFWGMAYEFFGKKAALFATTFFAFGAPTALYMTYGRSYIFVMLFGILLLWSLLKMIKYTPKKEYWKVWWLAGLFGFYSNPSFLYVWLGLHLVAVPLFIKKENIKHFLFYNSTLVFTLCLLYSPMLITGGGQTLFHAAESAQTTTFSYPDFWYYINRVADWWWLGQSQMVYFLVFVWWGFLGLFWYKSSINTTLKIILVLGFQLIWPTIWCWTTAIFPPYRIWCFTQIYIALIFGLGMATIFSKIKWSKKLLPVLAIVLWSISHHHYFANWSKSLDREAKEIAHFLIDQEAKTCYFITRYDKPLVEFYYLRSKKSLKSFMPFNQSKVFQPFEQQTYPFVVWDKDNETITPPQQQLLEANYKIIYDTYRINIYQAIEQPLR